MRGVVSILNMTSLITFFTWIQTSDAAEPKSISMKSGENVEVGSVYWVSACRSLLKGKPIAEILEGPPDVSVTIREQKVVPHSNNCAKPVPGGILVLNAPKEIKARTEGRLTVRIKLPTSDGERQDSRAFDITLFP